VIVDFIFMLRHLKGKKIKQQKTLKNKLPTVGSIISTRKYSVWIGVSYYEAFISIIILQSMKCHYRSEAAIAPSRAEFNKERYIRYVK